MKQVQVTIDISRLAERAGFEKKPDGSYILPNTQETADKLAALAIEEVKGVKQSDVIITGPAPVWVYLKVGHALHGHVLRLTYRSPIIEIMIFNHGFIEEA